MYIEGENRPVPPPDRAFVDYEEEILPVFGVIVFGRS